MTLAMTPAQDLQLGLSLQQFTTNLYFFKARLMN